MTPTPAALAAAEEIKTIPCEICGGSGLTPGWMPSYGNPDNAGCDEPAEPCACGNWEIIREYRFNQYRETTRAALSIAEDRSNRAWEDWNKAHIALFRHKNPEISAEVDAINIEKSTTEKRVKALRERLSALDLKLPQYFLNS